MTLDEIKTGFENFEVELLRLRNEQSTINNEVGQFTIASIEAIHGIQNQAVVLARRGRENSDAIHVALSQLGILSNHLADLYQMTADDGDEWKS